MFIVGYGGPEKLQMRDSPDPTPRGSEIRIRVRASGVNFADILARKGLYPDSPKIPCVLGYEGFRHGGRRRFGCGPLLDRQERLYADALWRLFRRRGRTGKTGHGETGFAIP